MRPSLIALGCACALASPTLLAQSASDALRQSWQAICPGATPGSELFERCTEIRDSGPGGDDRELAAAQGNNLELLSSQGRMVMATARQRLRRAQATAAPTGAAPAGFQAWLGAADSEEQASTLAGDGRWALIASVGAGRSERGESNLERAYGSDTDFALLGIDYRFSDSLQGVLALQQERSESDFARGTGSLENRTLALNAALSWAINERWTLQAGGNLGRIDSDLRRVIDYTLVRNLGTPQQDTIRVQSQADSQGRGDLRGLDLSLDWSRGWEAWTFRAGGQLSWQRTDLDEIVEDNPKGLDFVIAAQEISSRQASLNLEASRSVSFASGVWQPSLRLGWSHEFADDSRRIRARFRSGDQVFQAQFFTDAPDRDSGEVALGSSWLFPGGWQAYAAWQHSLGHDFLEEQRVAAGLRREF